MENSNQKASSIPSSLNGSPVHLIYLVERVITDDSEDDHSSKLDGDPLLCNGNSQYFRSNGISPQLGNLYAQDQTRSTRLHNSQLFMPSYSTSIDAGSQLNNVEDFAGLPHVEYSVDWNWLYQNIPFADFQSTQLGTNSASWLQGETNYLTQNSLSLNKSFANYYPQVNHAYSVRGWKWNNNPRIYGGPYNHDIQNSLELVDLNHVDFIECSSSSDGSRALQKILDKRDEKTNIIFNKTIENSRAIMTNKYGHHLFLKLIGFCNPSQLHMIVAEVTSEAEDLIAIACHEYGSQCLKWLTIKLGRTPQVATRIISALSSGFYGLMIHKTGSYAILRCLELFNGERNKVLYKKMMEHCIELATHEVGCVSINNCLPYVRGEDRYLLLFKISMYAAQLAHNPFGNFVIQRVIERSDRKITMLICKRLREHYVSLSQEKGGSHVVEKCLRSCGKEYVVNEFLKCNKLDLGRIASDQYGNFVLQTALREMKRAGSPLYMQLLGKLTFLQELEYGFGLNVRGLIEKGVPLDNFGVKICL